MLLIVAIIFYTLFKPKHLPSILLNKVGFFILGVFTGLLGPLIGATGPFLAVFFLRHDIEKEQIVATKAICQLVTHIVKIPVFIGLGFAYQEHWLLIVVLSLASILGTRIGVHLLGRISETFFRHLYRIVLFIAACRLLWKVFN